jgi:hypothetical protein
MMPATALPDRDRWIIVGSGVTLMLLFYLLLQPWDLAHSFMVGAPIGRDFVNFWLGGYLALHDRLDLLVDPQGYNALISQMFGHNPLDEFVFSYPPHLLLLLLPFGAMPFAAAITIWTILNVYSVFHAVELMRGRRDFAMLACAGPAVLMLVVYGHFEGVLALFAVFILIKGEERPLLAGVLLALMTVKPQLALMLAVFILLTGQWRIVAWSIPATLALVAISVITFGPKPWIDFVTWTVPYHAGLLSDFVLSQLKSTISIYAGARMLGLPGWLAQIIQWVASFAMLAGAVMVYGRRGAEPRSIAIALSMVVLAQPYANAYDLALAAPALTLALFAESQRDEQLFLPFIPALLFWTTPALASIFGAASWPVLPILLTTILLLAIARELAGKPAEGAIWAMGRR